MAMVESIISQASSSGPDIKTGRSPGLPATSTLAVLIPLGGIPGVSVSVGVGVGVGDGVVIVGGGVVVTSGGGLIG